jgi:hypothetical protein
MRLSGWIVLSAHSLTELASASCRVFMLVLFIVELVSFMSHSTETMVVLDPSNDQMVRGAMERPMTYGSADSTIWGLLGGVWIRSNEGMHLLTAPPP